MGWVTLQDGRQVYVEQGFVPRINPDADSKLLVNYERNWKRYKPVPQTVKNLKTDRLLDANNTQPEADFLYFPEINIRST